jgi:osmotically-inducible protein OsmY
MLDGSGVETAIVLEVTAALVANPPRELTVIEVKSREGVVTLKGEVGSTQLHTMAGEIASSHPGVEETVNALEIHGRVDADHTMMM